MDSQPHDGVVAGTTRDASAASQLGRHPSAAMLTPSRSPPKIGDVQGGYVPSDRELSSAFSASSRLPEAQPSGSTGAYAMFNAIGNFPSPFPTRTSPSDQTQTTSQISPGTAQALNEGVVDAEESVIPLQNVNWEHHGPWSWVSVCSQPGLRWVRERTGTDDFNRIATTLVKSWSRRLKMKRGGSAKRQVREPSKTAAWKYVTAYFEENYDAVFGIVHRPTFEARLRAHFDQAVSDQHEDPSWFALRNVVYAAGCRCVLAKDPSVSFVDAQAQSWQLFENALSVFTDIILGHSGLTAVQALTAMAFYTEGLGSPALEYPLCTNAVHLAQAKGLHREPSKSWGLSESDVQTRNWLWWAIYCVEKQIAFRSGRPSVIDDDNISTTIPTSAPDGSTINVEIFTFMIKHAQISAQISRRIMSVKAFQQSATEAITTIHDIHSQLEALAISVPLHLKVDTPIRPNDYMRPYRVHAVLLHFAIYGSIMATHIIMFYPWISIWFGTESNPTFQQQITRSAETIANAARQIILVLRSLTTDVSVPAAIAFYYPMYAHINLFVYLLRYPSLSTALGDLALLDICAGHFGHIEFLTLSEVSFHFPRESAVLASKTVKAAQGKAREMPTIPSTPQTATPTFTNAIIAGNLLVSGGSERQRLGSMQNGIVQSNTFDAMDFDMEAWNIFSSVDDKDNYNAIFEDYHA